jgi:hypothetical protein
VVVLNPDGEHMVAKDEVIEIDTPYIIRVAMSEKEYEKALTLKKSPGKTQAKAPIDKEVLSSVFNRKSH